MLKERIEQRLTELRAEYESGQKALSELEARQANLRTILLRVSGAIQVLEELLAETHPSGPGARSRQVGRDD